MNKRKVWTLELSDANLNSIFLHGQQDSHCIYLDSHDHQDPYGKYEKVLAWGALDQIELQSGESLSQFYAWQQKHKDWCFGALNYELKNEVEGLSNRHNDPIGAAHISFFQAKNLLLKERGSDVWHFESLDLDPEFLKSLGPARKLQSEAAPNFKPLISKERYIEDVKALLSEIQYGNIYEINYCQCFEAQGPLEAAAVFLKKNEEHQAPFSAFLHFKDWDALCFSPERYLRKEGQKIVSQPIKGTAARSRDRQTDLAAQKALLDSEKERAENVMIVDLVRNDLSRTAQKNSVQVEELFGLYPFNAVHQMISTVSSQLDETKFNWSDLIRSSFPMGSMTGAPKVSAMSLSDKHEHFNRGIYSGSVGYIDPKGNFDFNVVIRTILYNRKKQLARIAVGSAITIHCDPEQEYEECLLKAEKLVD